MNSHIEENAARGLDVGNWRWSGIATDDVHQMRGSDFALGYGLPDSCKIGVEAPVESDLELYPGLFHFIQGEINFRKRVVDRLFAEDVLPGVGGVYHKIGMSFRGRTNQNGIDRRVSKDVVAAL
jgi:hypothetical protein